MNKEDKINGDCILLELPKFPLAGCGTFSFWAGMKFKKKNSSDIFIGLINCIELYGSGFFEPGKVYKVVAKKPFEIPLGDIVRNDFAGSDLRTYKIEEIK